MYPRACFALSCEPEAEVIVFAVGRQCFFGVASRGVEVIAVAVFKEPQVLHFAVGVVLYVFESAKEQRLPHASEVGTERVHYVYSPFNGVFLEVAVV